MHYGQNFVRPISLTLLGLTFVYIILRAAFVPLFSDEVSTFFRYVQTGSFQPFLIESNANNHVLNSLLTHLSYLLFGDSPLALRLPNLLSYLLFAVYVLKFQRFFTSPVVAVCWVMVITGSHYFISFFHLTRGYGMSMAFVLAAMYHAIHYLKKGRKDHLFATGIFANLAAWANLSLLVPLIAIFGIVALRLIGFSMNRYTPRERFGAVSIFVVTGLLPFFYAVKLALDLKEEGALYHGTDEGFVSVIVYRLMAEFVPENWTAAASYFWPFFIIYLLGLVWILWKKKGDSSFFIVQEIFWLTLIGTIAMHLVLDVHYPLDRAALHFFPLFVLALFFVLARLPVLLAAPIAMVPALMFFVQQLTFFNFNRTSHWHNEHVPPVLLEHLKKWQDSTGILPLISVHGLPGRSFVYSAYRDGARLNSPVFEGFPASAADFILTYQWHVEYPDGFITRAEYPDVKMKLLERKVHSDWVHLETHRPEESQEGGVLAEINVDGSQFRALTFSFDATLQCNEYPFKAWLGLRILDSTGKEISFYHIDLARVKPDMAEKTAIRRRIFQDNLPEATVKAQLLFINVGGNHFSIEDSKVLIHALPRMEAEKQD